METLLDALLFDDELSAEEQDELQRRFEDDPALADAWLHWRRVRSYFRERLEDRVSDRRLLVLYVLEQEGDSEALTPSEQGALDAARDDIAQAVDAIPALDQVVGRIREEREEFEEVWETHAPSIDSAPDEERVFARERRRSKRAPRSPRSQSGFAIPQWSRRLALAVLIVGVAVGAFLLWPDGPPTTTVTVAEGERRTVDLGEGSTARVVGEATLSYPTTRPEGAPRRVMLQEGRAFFDVQRLSDNTAFVVQTPTATATVLGTQFGVTSTSDTTEVVLASGSVRVQTAGEENATGVVLEPGQKSWVAKGGAPAGPRPADLTAALDWTGLFVFRSVPLEDIVDRLSQRYDVSIAVAEGLRDEPITGTFEREQPVRQVLGALAATLGAEVEREEGGYRLVTSQ